MQVVSKANNIRVSPQKVRLVVTQIKKMKPTDALTVLEFTPQKAAGPLRKAIAAAVSNAKNNYSIDENTLTFSELSVGKGVSFKRFRAISRGRAHSILKQTSNINVILSGEKTKQVAKVETSEKKEPKRLEENTKEATNGTKS